MQTEFRIFLINRLAGPLLAEDCLNLVLVFLKNARVVMGWHCSEV